MEQIARFGPDEILTGILSEPEGDAPQSLVAVMWNAGLNHRVAPGRAWVELARMLAKRGVASLRFDLSGLGDSRSRDELVGDLERAVLDLQDALDWLEAKGYRRFVLVSNCSGTDNSHHVAQRDRRVVGAAYLDGYSYITRRYRLLRGPLRWFSPGHYRRRLMRLFPQAFGIPADARVVGARDEIYQRDYPSEEQFEAAVLGMVTRGVKLLYVFSGATQYAYRA